MLQDEPEELQCRQGSGFRYLCLPVFVFECHGIIACVYDVFIRPYASIQIVRMILQRGLTVANFSAIHDPFSG